MMGAVHILPGTTFSNTKAREGYASEERAVLSLRELERWLAVEITEVYQRRIHSALLRPPLAVWQELQGGLSFDLPPDRMAFWTSFLPETRRQLLKDGIHLEKIRYWSDVLARDLGRSGEMRIKYDPRDLSRIFVRRPDGGYTKLDTGTSLIPQSPSGSGATPSVASSNKESVILTRMRFFLPSPCNAESKMMLLRPAQRHVAKWLNGHE